MDLVSTNCGPLLIYGMDIFFNEHYLAGHFLMQKAFKINNNFKCVHIADKRLKYFSDVDIDFANCDNCLRLIHKENT